MRSDVELLDAWRGGDLGAGRALFERHISALSRFFRTKVGDEREDLIQTTFLACVESRDRVRDGTSFRAYLFRIARNALYDHLVRAHRGPSRPDPLTQSILDLGTSPSRMVAKTEQDRLLLLALRRLPVALQILLELHYWEGLTTADLAEALDIPRGTVKTRLFRARALLREQLQRSVPGGAIPEASLQDLDGWARSLRDAGEQ
ncbi:MAG: sigma-70 family RNA polymerase sigma factor [Deltaproteobacteria bacterium]|nr:sigma-70 family RNA polymerase sigma factor [Deltaproteobacteria bacterium]